MPHRRLGAAVVAVALLAVPTTASAQDALTTPTDGFKVSRTSKGKLRLDIGRAANPLFKRIAGRRAVALCQEETQATGPYLVGFAQGAQGQSFRFRMPAKRKGITLRGNLPTGLDTCAIDVAPKGNRPSVSLALALTDVGAAALTERKLVARMLVAATIAGTLAEKNPNQAYPATDVFAQALARPAAQRLVGPVEALAGPDGGPATPGALGVWTDGGTRAVFVAFNDAGRRIALEASGDTLSINSQYLLR